MFNVCPINDNATLPCFIWKYVNGKQWPGNLIVMLIGQWLKQK